MARAKSTDRAEARRRHRAIVAAAALTEPADDLPESTGDEAPSASAAGSTSRSSTARPAAPRPAAATSAAARTGSPRTAADKPAARPGILSTFRAAARPVDVRSDLAYLPELILHTRAVWVPSLAIVGAGLVTLIAPANQITQLLAQIFVAPPSLAGPFLAGLLAPRATYLAGGIVGIVAAIVLTIAILLIPSSLFAGPVDRGAIVAYAAVVSPIFGLAVGGFAGYYRRFLFLSSPNTRRRQTSAKNSNRASSKRR